MATLEIPEVVKFEVTAVEFVQVAGLILSQTKAAKMRTAMKTMIDELNKSNERLVEEVLVPLCSIGTSEKFDEDFRKIHERFKKQYFGDRPVFFVNKLRSCDATDSRTAAIPAMEKKPWVFTCCHAP